MDNNQVKWRSHSPVPIPNRSYASDCGYDLIVVGHHNVMPSVVTPLPCGLSVEFPDEAWGLIVGRSSARRDHGLFVHVAVIDAGFRGELFVDVTPIDGKAKHIEHGQRIGQIIPLPTMALGWGGSTWVEALSESDRGDKGFGSSGK